MQKSGGNIKPENRRYVASRTTKILMFLVTVFAAIGILAMAVTVIENITKGL